MAQRPRWSPVTSTTSVRSIRARRWATSRSRRSSSCPPSEAALRQEVRSAERKLRDGLDREDATVEAYGPVDGIDLHVGGRSVQVEVCSGKPARVRNGDVAAA